MVMYWILFCIFTILQLFDIWSTSTILRRGGKELNKIMRLLINKLGVLPALILTKCLICVLVVLGGLFLPMYNNFITILLSLMCMFYIIMMMRYNAKSIFKRIVDRIH